MAKGDGAKYLVGIFATLFLVTLVIVAGIETKKSESTKPEIELTGKSKQCVTCHEKKGIAVKQIEQWKDSKHAEYGIGCIECHAAQKGDFDAFTCPGSDILIGRYPTPKDCSTCHEKEVKDYADSKHAHQFWLLHNDDRAVYEFPMAVKHGCEQCHRIGQMWPDGSVGDCSACHARHSFKIAQARNPKTCGECHLGPDHPQIEIYEESKHGNIWAAEGKNWDMSYETTNHEKIPIKAPVCTTCHMDGSPTQPFTHNVSARLAWESQAPWSYRTVWDEEHLGTWQKKRERMKEICLNCHAPDFINEYFLEADLVNLQYNEIRRQFVYWNKKLYAEKIMYPWKVRAKMWTSPVLDGYDQLPEREKYYAWHHEGRRFRFGAEMMGADFTQWHGIWEVQQDFIEMLNWAADHGDPDAKIWQKSNNPTKMITFKLYDVPGNEWGINTELYKPNFVYQMFPDYWTRIKSNVKAAYDKGLLSQDQWELWLKRYKKKDYYMGTKFPQHPKWQFYKDRDKKDLKHMRQTVINLNLPGQSYYKDMH